VEFLWTDNVIDLVLHQREYSFKLEWAKCYLDLLAEVSLLHPSSKNNVGFPYDIGTFRNRWFGVGGIETIGFTLHSHS
jgi:hypothetical protein